MTTPFADAVRQVHDEFADHREEAAVLVGLMTFEEKLGCLDGDLDAWAGLAEMATGGYHQRTFPAAVVERLGIPGLQFSDGPRGCVVGEKTAFPVSMARGATWDPSLEERIGDAIGANLSAHLLGAAELVGVTQCVADREADDSAHDTLHAPLVHNRLLS